MSNQILDTLRQIGDGSLVFQASEKLNELVMSINNNGGVGKIDLTISVKKSTRGGAMHVTGKIKLTKPAETPMEAMLFSTDDGRLVIDNPNQKKLDLKVIDDQPKTLKQIGE